MFTKKNILWASGLIGGGLLILEPIKTSAICGVGATTCIDAVFAGAMILFVFPFVFLFSLITYFFLEPVFRGWINFTKWWVPLQMILVILTPESAANPLVNIVDKQSVAILLSGIFVVISLIIVVWKWSSAHRRSTV